MKISIREERFDLYDKDGYVVERDVLHLIGETYDAKSDRFFCFTMVPGLDIDGDRFPERMKLLHKMVEDGVIRAMQDAT